MAARSPCLGKEKYITEMDVKQLSHQIAGEDLSIQAQTANFTNEKFVF